VLYFFTLGVTLLMFVLGWNLLRGRIGRALVAIRDQHIASEAMGIHNALYKSLAFGVSAIYRVAGALGALAVQFVAPTASRVPSIVFLVASWWAASPRSAGSLRRLFIQFIPTSPTRSRRPPPGRSSACS